MAKIIKQTRFTLVSKRNIKLYTFYAVAEIMLVVVGILLAMQVSDWSEEQKRKEQLQNIYKALYKDLKNDKNKIQEITTLFEKNKNHYENILNGNVSRSRYAQDKSYSHILLRHTYFSVNKRGFNLLQNHLDASFATNDSLNDHIIQFYTENIHKIERVREMMNKEHDYVIEKWADKYAWFYKLNEKKLSSDYLDFLMNDPRFKNDVLTRKNRIYLNFVPTLKAYEKQTDEILTILEKKHIKKIE